MMSEPAIDWSFETSSVRATLIAKDDRALYRMLYTDPDVMDKIGAVMSEGDVDVLFEKVCRCNAKPSLLARYWRLSDRVSGTPIGQLSAIRTMDASSCIELGLMLVPASQGHGFAAEVSAQIVDCLMGDRWKLGAHSVMACSAPANAGVDRLADRLGFRHEGRSAAGLNQWLLTRPDWQARREASGQTGFDDAVADQPLSDAQTGSGVLLA